MCHGDEEFQIDDQRAAGLCFDGVRGILSASAAEPKQVTSIEGITEYQLENGLKVLLFPDASKPTVTVNLTIFVGSRHEGYGEAGMAHLLEHMVFKGTPTFADIPGRAQRSRGRVQRHDVARPHELL